MKLTKNWATPVQRGNPILAAICAMAGGGIIKLCTSEGGNGLKVSFCSQIDAMMAFLDCRVGLPSRSGWRRKKLSFSQFHKVRSPFVK